MSPPQVLPHSLGGRPFDYLKAVGN